MKTGLTLLISLFIGLVFFMPNEPLVYPPKKVLDQQKEIKEKEIYIDAVIAVLEKNIDADTLNIVIAK